MNTKIKLLFAVSLCLISSVIVAQPVSIQTAVTIAEHHLASVSQSTLKSKSLSGSSFRFTSVKATVENKDTLYYILNDTINRGFVIVSADQRSWPILGYSTTGSFDEESQPEAFTAWMENRKKEIEHIKKNNIQANSAIKERWQNFNLKSSTIETKSVEPLIKTQWDQGCFYNAMCPADPTAGNCGRVPVGCTITAMAQIMKYWNYPTKGVGSHSYEHPTYGNLSADFGSTTYQWSQMPNSVITQNDAVATLMYHCGVSLDAEYGPDASGAWDPRDELVQYFDYASTSMLVNRAGFATSDWIQLLKSELDLGHPIFYMGSGSVAHSFICDGYEDADYFHFNWGWSGSSDGYFYIGNLNPGWYSFNENQSALLNLVPGNLPDGYNGFFLSSNSVDIATKGGTTSVDVCSSVTWTASSDQSWLSLSTDRGVSGKTTLTFTATENQTGNDRSAKVTVSVPGFGTQTITVNQMTKVNVTPGGLYNIIANNASSITQLTLTGTIDARDFKTMRDAMPALTDVDLSDATIISYSGVDGPSSPENMTYPANEIPEFAFAIVACKGQNRLKSIILPSSISSIGNCSFKYCSYLSKIYIPSSVVNIIWNAFGSCSALINVDSANPNYSSIDGVLFDKNQTKLIQCPMSKMGDYTMPSSVNTIRMFAFESCGKLKSVTIPSSVTTIEEFAFTDCSASINVDVNNLNYSSSDGVLFNKEQNALIHCPTSKTGNYAIPSSVVSIGDYAFELCARLTNVTIPMSVSSIGNSAFCKCSGLKMVSIPSSVISIGASAFYSCKGLLDLTIPLSVKNIEMEAFSLCGNLRSINCYSISPISFNSYDVIFDKVAKDACVLNVPYGSKSAYQLANQWKDFKTIVEMPGIFISSNRITMESEVDTVRIAISSSSDWTATSDQSWLTINTLAGAVGSNAISLSATANSTIANRTATVTISAIGLASQIITVTQSGDIDVTAGNLKTILAGQLSTIISLTLTGTIDARDFKTMRDEMPVLADVDLRRVKIVEYYGSEGTIDTNNNLYPANCVPNSAFYNQNIAQGKSGLKSVLLPLSTNVIGIFAFNNCTDLTTIDIPLSVSTIDGSAFNHCTGLTSINIPASVKYIANGAFDYFNGKITVAEDNPFYSAIDGVLLNKNQTTLIQCPISKTGEYTIPLSVTNIGNNAFSFCRGLTKVTIPSSINSIGNSAFFNCANLRSVYTYPRVPINLDQSNEAFFLVDKDSCKLYVPYGTKDAYQNAIGWKDFQNIVEMPNQAPVANAGSDQTIKGGRVVALDGSGSIDAEGILLTYKWTAPAGITLSSAISAKPTFTAPAVVVDTNFTFSLIVNDGYLDSPADEVVVTVTLNNAPIAIAGADQSVKENSPCTLDGSASFDSDNDELIYLWTAPSGISLSSATSAKPIFTAPKVSSDTVFVFSLEVNDGTVDSPADEVMITVRNINNAPVANAGIDQTVMEGGTVILDGSSSFDPDGTAISYLWSAPAGVTLNKSDLANPTFVVPDVSELTRFSFLLTVSDDQYTSQPDTVVITVEKKTGIDDDELISPKQVQVYPNPTTGLLTISMEDYLGQSPLVEVFNSMGQLVLKTESAVDARNIEIDMSAYSQGIYTLRISVGNKHFQQKIVKK
jgi:hypothetical protein